MFIFVFVVVVVVVVLLLFSMPRPAVKPSFNPRIDPSAFCAQTGDLCRH